MYIFHVRRIKNLKQYKLWGGKGGFDKEDTIFIIIIIYGIMLLPHQIIIFCV